MYWYTSPVHVHVRTVLCRGRGEGGRWESQVYPDMKQALVHVLQVTQDEVHQRKVGEAFLEAPDL